MFAQFPSTYQESTVEEGQGYVELPREVEKQNFWRTKKVVGVILVAVIIGCFALIGPLSASGGSSATIKSAPRTVYKSIVQNDFTLKDGITYVSTDEMFVEASNEYGVFDAPYSWMTTIAGTQLVEPYKNTTLTLTGSMVESDYKFRWSLTDYDGEFIVGSDALTQTVYLTTTGTRQLWVEAFDSDGKLMGTYTTRIVCKYVKREIRSLTEEDRERFLNAAYGLWQYTLEEGQELFGPAYTPISVLVAEHSMASNDIMCDQFHEGSGFITHHLALQSTFEASMRAIDPAASLHYWDFTIEGQAVENAGEVPSFMLEVTPIFSDTWFGSVDPDTFRIQDSRWAHSPMPKQSDLNSGVQNSYGYIRSYWNNNEDPEVTRSLFNACGVEPVHKRIPSCSDHFSVLDSATLGDFQVLSPADGHGPIHVQVGGMWGGCNDAYASFIDKWGDVLSADMTDDEIEQIGYTNGENPDLPRWKWGNSAPRQLMLDTAVMGEYFHIYRSFWRSHMCAVDGTPHLLNCPDECSEDTPFEECTCQVDTLVSGETTWQNLYPCLLNSEENQQYFNSSMPQELLEDLIYMMATASVKEGEMIESASTADIVFWVTHPAIERLLTAKRLPDVTDMAGQEFSKWAVVDGSAETWLEYSYYTFGVGENPYFNDEAYTCYGHAADDMVLPAGLTYTEGIANIADADNDGTITNWEFFIALDPNNVDGNDYVFDNFKWDHCEEFSVSSKGETKEVLHVHVDKTEKTDKKENESPNPTDKVNRSAWKPSNGQKIPS